MFKAFQTIDVSYSDATYRLVKNRGGTFGVLKEAVKELLARRMPSHRIWNILRTNGRCVKISAGVSAPKGTAKPYDPYIVKNVILTANPSVQPDLVDRAIRQALTVFGNESLSEPAPTLILIRGGRQAILPKDPTRRTETIKTLFDPS